MGEEDNEKKPAGKKWIVIIVVILLGIFCGVIYMDQVSGDGKILAYFMQHQEKQTEEKPIEDKSTEGKLTEKQTEEPELIAQEKTETEMLAGNYISLDADGKASFLPMDSGFYMCSKDGVKLYTDMETQKWSETFTMGNPVMVQAGKYLAVGDLFGNAIRVYGSEGFLYEARAEGTLGYFSINESGYLGVINHGKSAYGVTVYDNLGKKVKGRVEETAGIYPLSLDISADNRVFAVSYLDTTDVEVIGRVLYFYIDVKEGEKFADSMFAAVEKQGEVLSRIAFLENDILAVISDKSIYGISISGVEKWKKSLTNRIDQMVIADKKYLILACGDSISEKESSEVGTVLWIDGSGKVESDFSTKEKINYLSGTEAGAVVGVGRKYYGLKKGGGKVWEHNVRQEMKDILIMGKETQILYVTMSTAQIFQTTSKQWEKNEKDDTSKKIVTKYEVVPPEDIQTDLVEGKKEEVETTKAVETKKNVQ